MALIAERETLSVWMLSNLGNCSRALLALLRPAVQALFQPFKRNYIFWQICQAEGDCVARSQNLAELGRWSEQKAGLRARNRLRLGQLWEKGAHVCHDYALDKSASLQ